jgi:lipoprotein-releasing system permease protein
LIWVVAILTGLDLVAAPFGARWLLRRGGSPRLLAALLAVLGVLGLALWAGFHFTDLSIERNAAGLWAYAGVAIVAVSFAASRAARRMPTPELFVALVLVLEVAVVLAVATGEGSLASPPFRALLVAPAALPLAAYFGASVGYLAAAGIADLWPGYEAFVARRFLLSKASAVLSTVTTIAMIGVALGVWLVIVSLAVLSGFENDLQNKIIGATAHLSVETKGGMPFVLSGHDATTVAQTRGVVDVSPVVEGEVAVSSSSNYTGALFFGIDPARAVHVLGVLKKLSDGSLTPLSAELAPPPEVPPADAGEFPPPAPLPGIVIGIEMAKGLNVGVGDRVRVISPILETMTPVGPAPKSATFQVAAVFDSKMYEYDARYVFVSVRAARRFLEVGDDEVTAVQVATSDPERSDDIARSITDRLGASFEAHDWKSRNQTLFSALKLERVVAFVVLVFIILVASFAIVNTLTMSVIEKKKEIAILKTMGARDGGIMKLFLTEGLIVGAFGTLVGTAAAVATVKWLETFGFTIPGDVYYIDRLPVHMEAQDLVVVLVAALLIIWDFAVFPALRGSRLSPVEGLRDA